MKAMLNFGCFSIKRCESLVNFRYAAVRRPFITLQGSLDLSEFLQMHHVKLQSDSFSAGLDMTGPISIL